MMSKSLLLGSLLPLMGACSGARGGGSSTDSGGAGLSTVDSDGDGLSPAEGDCDDDDSSIFPGAEDLCDGVDQDCDGGERGVAFVDQRLEIVDWTAAFESGSAESPVELTFNDPGTLHFCGGTWYVELESAASSLEFIGHGGFAENVIGSQFLHGAGGVYSYSGLTIAGRVWSEELSTSVGSVSMTEVVVEDEVSLEVENLTLDGFRGGDVWGGGLGGGDVSVTDCEVTSLHVGNSGDTSIADCVASEAMVFGGVVVVSSLTVAGSLSLGDGTRPLSSADLRDLTAGHLGVVSSGLLEASALEVGYLSIGGVTTVGGDANLSDVVATGGLFVRAGDVSISRLEVTSGTLEDCADIEATSLDLEGASLSGCQGTGLRVITESDVRLVDIEVHDALGRGIYLGSGDDAPEVENVTVTGSGSAMSRGDDGDPWASGSGGGVFVVVGAEAAVTASGLYLEGNQALVQGGGLSVFTIGGDGQRAAVVISDSTFIGNQAASGGGLYCEWDCEVANSVFEGNAADADRDPYPKVAGGMGGAIAAGRTVRIVDSSFTGNDADYGGAVHGGVLYAPTSLVTLERCEVTDNTADHYAAVSANDVEITASRSTGNSGGGSDYYTSTGSCSGTTSDDTAGLAGTVDLSACASTDVRW